MADVLRQLLIQKPDILSELESSYERSILNKTHISRSECFKLLQAEVNGFSKVFIIIDALDECSDADTLLSKIRGLQPKVCLLVTSRYAEGSKNQVHKTSHLEIQASDEDIRRYLEDRMSIEKSLKDHVKPKRKLRDTITTTIVAKARGM